MEEHISDSLYLPWCHIMNSDDDQPIVMEITAAFNESEQLVICLDVYDYEEPEYDCSTAVVVNLEDSRKMARHHRVKHGQLPKFISECMEEWREIINPTFIQVQACFKEITECLLDEGCRFKIKRTYGKGGYMCY